MIPRKQVGMLRGHVFLGCSPWTAFPLLSTGYPARQLNSQYLSSWLCSLAWVFVSFKCLQRRGRLSKSVRRLNTFTVLQLFYLYSKVSLIKIPASQSLFLWVQVFFFSFPCIISINCSWFVPGLFHNAIVNNSFFGTIIPYVQKLSVNNS